MKKIKCFWPIVVLSLTYLPAFTEEKKPMSSIGFYKGTLDDAAHLTFHFPEYHHIFHYCDTEQAFAILHIKNTNKYLFFMMPDIYEQIIEPPVFKINGKDAIKSLKPNEVRFYGISLKGDGTEIDNLNNIVSREIGAFFHLKKHDSMAIKVVRKCKNRTWKMEASRDKNGAWNSSFISTDK